MLFEAKEAAGQRALFLEENFIQFQMIVGIVEPMWQKLERKGNFLTA